VRSPMKDFLSLEILSGASKKFPDKVYVALKSGKRTWQINNLWQRTSSSVPNSVPFGFFMNNSRSVVVKNLTYVYQVGKIRNICEIPQEFSANYMLTIAYLFSSMYVFSAVLYSIVIVGYFLLSSLPFRKPQCSLFMLL
jgi:hypothetical protein